MSKLKQLQLESQETETRAIYSAHHSQVPVPDIFRTPRTEEDTPNRDNDEIIFENEGEKSDSRLKSSLPGRTSSSRLE